MDHLGNCARCLLRGVKGACDVGRLYFRLAAQETVGICYAHCCGERWGHRGRCVCACGYDLGRKTDRQHGLDGYLSCGPIVNKRTRRAMA